MVKTADRLNRICHYATQEEIDFQRDIMAKKIKRGSKMVMIGAGPGVLLVSLLEGLEHDEIMGWVIDIDTCSWVKKHIMTNVHLPDSIKYGKKIKYIDHKDSCQVGLYWMNGKIDYLIIDGDHSEMGIKRDMFAWLNYIKKGGFVLFHDYSYEGSGWGDPDWIEVKPFVDPEMERRNWNLIHRFGCSAVFEVG